MSRFPCIFLVPVSGFRCGAINHQRPLALGLQPTVPLRLALQRALLLNVSLVMLGAYVHVCLTTGRSAVCASNGSAFMAGLEIKVCDRERGLGRHITGADRRSQTAKPFAYIGPSVNFLSGLTERLSALLDRVQTVAEARSRLSLRSTSMDFLYLPFICT